MLAVGSVAIATVAAAVAEETNFANRNKYNPYSRKINPKNQFKNKGNGDGTNHNASVNGSEAAENKPIVQCYICHQRGDHDSIGRPNGSVRVKRKNWSF